MGYQPPQQNGLSPPPEMGAAIPGEYQWQEQSNLKECKKPSMDTW
jgi:hypothetical protein